MIATAVIENSRVGVLYNKIPCGSRRGNIWYDFELVNEDTGRAIEDVTFQRSYVNNLERVHVSNLQLEYDTPYTINVFGIYAGSPRGYGSGPPDSASVRTVTEAMFFPFSFYSSSAPFRCSSVFLPFLLCIKFHT